MTVEQLRDELERLVDSCTLSQVVSNLAAVCQDKAEHILTNWQDKNTARSWRKAASHLERLTPRLEV